MSLFMTDTKGANIRKRCNFPVFRQPSYGSVIAQLNVNPPRFDQVISCTNLMTGGRIKKVPGGPGFKEFGYEKNFLRQHCPIRPTALSKRRSASSEGRARTPLAPIMEIPKVPHKSYAVASYRHPSYQSGRSYGNLGSRDVKPFTELELRNLIRTSEDDERPRKKKGEKETLVEFVNRMNTRFDGSVMNDTDYAKRAAQLRQAINCPIQYTSSDVSIKDDGHSILEVETARKKAMQTAKLRKRLVKAIQVDGLNGKSKEAEVKVIFAAKNLLPIRKGDLKGSGSNKKLELTSDQLKDGSVFKNIFGEENPAFKKLFDALPQSHITTVKKIQKPPVLQTKATLTNRKEESLVNPGFNRSNQNPSSPRNALETQPSRPEERQRIRHKLTAAEKTRRRQIETIQELALGIRKSSNPADAWRNHDG